RDPLSFPTRRSSDLNGLHRRPLRRILTAMLLHQSNGTLTDFRRKFVVLAHGSIFSKVGASSKPGAIHVTVDGSYQESRLEILFEDRKSTRLNSSHVK